MMMLMLRTVTLLAAVVFAGAHNWMHTPSRGRRRATTVKGCMMRKGTDTHAQIGPGQRMSLKPVNFSLRGITGIIYDSVFHGLTSGL